MSFLISLFVALASLFGGQHGATASRDVAHVAHDVHVAGHVGFQSGSGPVGSPQP